MCESKKLFHHHGDIIFGLEQEAPAEHVVMKAGRVVIGLGESSGHQHIIEECEVLTSPEVTEEQLARFVLTGELPPGGVFVRIAEPTRVVHDKAGMRTGEHDDVILIEPGTVWRVWRGQESFRGDFRPVGD